MKTRTRNEAGQASVLEAALVIFVVFMIALPLFEYGRMTSDSISAASAAEDAVKTLAANPSMSEGDVLAFVSASYPAIAANCEVSVSRTPTRQETYDHKLNVEGGGYVVRPSKVTWSEATVKVTVKRDFATSAGQFISNLTQGASGYEVTKSASATLDQSVMSGAW